MYGIQVIRNDNAAFGCIRYFQDGSSELIEVRKLYKQYSNEYCCICSALSDMARSTDSYVYALRKLFSEYGSLNILDSGALVPCTPLQCGGKDLFGVWMSGHRVYIENRTISSPNRFVLFDLSGIGGNLIVSSVWYGYYVDKKKSGISLRVKFSGVFRNMFSDNDWASHRDFEVFYDGVRNLSGGGEHFVKYKTAKEIMIGG